MIRKEKHIEIRLRVLEQLDEMLGLLKTGDGFPRRSQSDNRPIPKQDFSGPMAGVLISIPLSPLLVCALRPPGALSAPENK